MIIDHDDYDDHDDYVYDDYVCDDHDEYDDHDKDCDSVRNERTCHNKLKPRGDDDNCHPHHTCLPPVSQKIPQ